MITSRQKAEIRRLYATEKWKKGTIAKQLGLHHQTVAKALEEAEASKQACRTSKIDPFIPFILEVLDKHPGIVASRIQQMIAQRGYKGSIYTLRRAIKKLRPKAAKVFQDLQFFPGEAAQVDWADFGKFEVTPGVFRRLSCFVMILAYSRKIFARVFYDQKMGAVLEGHVEAFAHFDGVPKRIMYDNMKTAVVTNLGRGVEFNESLLQLAGHYHFECRACAPRAAWQKGRVERCIRYIRDNFSPKTRTYRTIEELNLQLREWLYETASQRPWPDDTNQTVDQAFAKEKSSLISLRPPFPFYDEAFCKVSKKSMVQYDCNLYSVPPKYVSLTLTVRATSGHVMVYDSSTHVTTHKRSWSKGQKVVMPEHLDAVIEASKSRLGYQHRSAIVQKLPSGQQLIDEWLRLGESLSQQSRLVSDLIKAYGKQSVETAAKQALDNKTPRAKCISMLLINHKRQIQPRYQRSDLDQYTPGKHDLSTYDHL